MRSSCDISFYRNDLQRARLWAGKCPVKNCSVNVGKYRAPFQKHKDLPYCPEHGIRIHGSGFVYYNGPSLADQKLSTKRNLMFHADYCIAKLFHNPNKVESHRLCYESSEDAVSYNVFSELFSKQISLKKIASHIIDRDIHDDIELYLWGEKIDLKDNRFNQYEPLRMVREYLEPNRKGPFKPPTEPDIMLVVPKKITILIEAKFGSKNPIAEDEAKINRKRRTAKELINDYIYKNKILEKSKIFDFNSTPKLFYEQLFRNIVFAASMAKVSDATEWHVANIRNQHVMNLKRGKPESMPIMRNVRSMLKPKYKKRFSHLTWEQIYDVAIKNNENLYNLSWYLKNKSLNCGRAFNII